MSKGAEVQFYGQLWTGGTTAAIRYAAGETARYAVQLLKKENRAKAYDTGRMTNSWSAQLADRGILLKNSAPYSGYVINGTKRMKGRPILQDALPEIEKRFRLELGKAIGREVADRVTQSLSTSVSFGQLTGGVPK